MQQFQLLCSAHEVLSRDIKTDTHAVQGAKDQGQHMISIDKAQENNPNELWVLYVVWLEAEGLLCLPRDDSQKKSASDLTTHHE